MGLEQLIGGVPWGAVVPNGVGVCLLVDAEHAGHLLHAEVAAEGAHIAQYWQFGVEFEKFRHRLGDDVVVGGVDDGQVEAIPLTDLAGIGAAGVDHVLADDVALLRDYPPFTARQRLDVGDPVRLDNLGAHFARPGGKRQTGAGRVHMTVVHGVMRRLDAIEVVERK